jgi:GTP-binding protein
MPWSECQSLNQQLRKISRGDKMEIKKCEFVTSAVNPEQYPEEALPHVVLVGKSNVGKSSFINCLTNNYKLARISGEPGKTRLINFYKLNDEFYIVDLPGYGFARVSHNEKQKWKLMIDTYLRYSMSIAVIIQIVDIRHQPTGEDIQMMEWIRESGFPVVVVANKADKLGKTRRRGQLAQISKKLRIPPHIPIISFSAQDRTGREEVLESLDALIPRLHRVQD